MKKSVKLFLSVFVIVLLACSLVLTGCAISSEKHVCVVSIEQTGTNGLEDVYTVTYSDGYVSTFTVTNGQDGEAEINVVWTYLSFLRKKIAALSDRASIKSIRNAGYTLECDDVSEST